MLITLSTPPLAEHGSNNYGAEKTRLAAPPRAQKGVLPILQSHNFHRSRKMASQKTSRTG
jgi:hypothetical protein